MALLGSWTSGLESRLRDDAELVDLLRRHAKAEHRHLKPLWKRKVGGRLWRSLDEPAGDGTTLRDVVTDHRRPEDSVFYGELEDPRVLAVLRSLKPAEAAVAAAYSSSRMTWAEAAAEAGVSDPAGFGERVRRKLKRLGACQLARTAAIACAARRAAG
jgi:hypothetical protein